MPGLSCFAALLPVAMSLFGGGQGDLVPPPVEAENPGDPVDPDMMEGARPLPLPTADPELNAPLDSDVPQVSGEGSSGAPPED